MQDWEVRASINVVPVTIPKVFLNQSDESKEAARKLAAKSVTTEAEAEVPEAEVTAEGAHCKPAPPHHTSVTLIRHSIFESW